VGIPRPMVSHVVSVVTGGKQIPDWKNYSISVDMLQPADQFSMSLQFTPEAWELVAPDSEVTVLVDKTQIITGYVDERTKSSGDGTTIEIRGRDKTGRLVDESAPLFQYGGLNIKDLAEKIIGIGVDKNPPFERVTLSNTKNRSLLRSKKAYKAKFVPPNILFEIAPFFQRAVLAQTNTTFGLNLTAVENYVTKYQTDPGIFKGRAATKKVPPGMTRWAVLEEFLKEARLLAWSSADGKELFIGEHNRLQDPQYAFFESSPQSPNRDLTNCSITITESVSERYSQYTAVGASRGSSANYGKNVTKRRGIALDNPDGVEGVGRWFKRPKRLLISDDSIKTAQQATERAEREQLQRDATALEIGVSAAGHGQVLAGEQAALFTVDTVADIIDESTGIGGKCTVVSIEYTGSGNSTRTKLSLVPLGTQLSL